MKQKIVEPEFYDSIETPVGMLHLIFSSSFLTAIEFKKPKLLPLKRSSVAAQVKKELTEYFGEGRREFECKTEFIQGTPFERQVWLALKEVPYGETRTYKWMAEKVGNPRACRAVGQALGKNPIPIVLPCHRIIESDGRLGGYSSGIEIKRRLLEIEYYQSSYKC